MLVDSSLKRRKIRYSSSTVGCFATLTRASVSCDQQSARALAVGIGVGSAQVAQGVLDPEGACLEEKPLMRGPPAGGGDSQSDFERHVEAGCAAGELNATEIVKGVPAYGNQL